MSYKVQLDNGKSLTISDNLHDSIELRKIQGMISTRQAKWLAHVVSMNKIRTYNDHRIHETKDYFDGDCYRCQKRAEQYNEQRGWGTNDL